MASSTSPEANEIRRRGRRRLIGAIAIALALVVFVPMLFDPAPRPARNEPVLQIPARENAPALPAPEASPRDAKAPAAAVAEPPKPAASVKSSPPPKPAALPAAAAAPKLEGFAVQVGAFKDDDKLKQARERLAAAGIAHYIERIDGASGTLTRLRAGPFATREAAESARASIKLAALDGQVVPLP